MSGASRFSPSPNRIEGDARVSGSLVITGDLIVQGSTALSGSGEANTASNLGSGQGVFASKNLLDLRFRSILGAGLITVISGTNEITISASLTGAAGEVNTASNTGSGEGVFLSKSGVNLIFRSISGSGGIAVISGSNGTIILSSSNAVASVAGINLGSGEPVFSHTQDGTFYFRTLQATGSISLISGANSITISGSPGEVATASNLGSGEGLFASKLGSVFTFRSLTASGSISLVSGANELNISSSAERNLGENIGSGQGIYLDQQGVNLRFRSIAGQGGITISSGTSGTINISSTIPTGQQNVGENIGSGQGIYVDNQGVNLRLRSIAGQGFVTVSSGTSGTINVSGSPSGEINTATNTGSGEGLFIGKTAADLRFRTLTAAGSISLVSGANELNISSSAEANTASNTGKGEGIWLDKQGVNLRFRSLVGQGAVSIASGALGTIVISSTIPTGEINTASNSGTGQGLFIGKTGVDLRFRVLTASGSISLVSGANELNISSSAERNLGENIGTGQGVYLDQQGVNLRFRSLNGQGGITISSGTSGTINISSTVPTGEINTASNTGTGEGLFIGKTGVDLRFRVLTASGSISLVSGANELNISSSAQNNTGENIGSGEGVFLDKQGVNLRFRSISGSGAIVVSSGSSGTIIISGNAFGEVNTASNIGSGQGVFANKLGVDLSFRSLLGAGVVSLVSGANDITISASAITGIFNTGVGEGVFLDATSDYGARFRTLVGTGGTSISSGALGTIVISSAVGGGSGEVNTASSLGGGQAITAYKAGTDLVFRSISASGSISVVSGTNSINISSSSPTGAFNTGTGEGVYLDTTSDYGMRFRSLVGQGAVSVASGALGTIVISSTIPTGEINTASNTGSGQGLFIGKTGVDLRFRTLTASGSISLVSGANELNISSSAERNLGENIGSGQGIYVDNQGVNLRLRSIAGQGGITVSSGTSGTINISSTIPTGEINTASNTGTGEGVWLDKVGVDLRFRSLVGQGSTTVSSGALGTIIISSTIPTGEINTASNSGTGQGLFIGKTGVDLRFRVLTASGSISLVSGANELNISSSAERNLGENIGSGQAVYLDQQGVNLRFRSIAGQGFVTVSSGTSGTINISGSPSGETNTASNTGTGEGVWLDKVGVDLRFRSLVGQGAVSVASGALGTIVISSTTPTGEINTASNTGTGEGLFIGKTGVDLRFRVLTASGSISLVSGANELNISSSAENNNGLSIGSGEAIFLDKQGTNLRFRSISGSGAISVVSGTSGTIIISGNAFGEVNTASNLGAGQGVFANKLGVDLGFRSLLAGGIVSLISGTNDITISASAVTGVFNTGTGEGVFLDATSDYGVRLRSLVGQGSTTVSSGALGTIIISSTADGGSGEINTASNTGTGEGVWLDKVGVDLRFRSLTGSGNTSVISGANGTIIISSSGGGGIGETIFTTITGGFGSNFWVTSSVLTQTFSGTTIAQTVEAIALNDISLPSGTYRVETQFAWWNSATITSLQLSMSVNGSQIGALYREELNDANAEERILVHRVDYVPITGGLTTFRLAGFMSAASTGSVTDMHLAVWRVDQGVSVIQPDSDQYILAMQVFS